MTDRPNILVIMTDQQRATASHLYGNTFCQTPSMERLAADGVLFENAITPHPLCVPARISFWTSQFPHSHGGRRNQTLMPADAEHAWQLWKEAGYTTGLIGKNHCFQREEDLALFDVWNAFTHGGRDEGPQTRGMDWFRPEEGRRKVAAEHRQLAHQNPRFSYGTSELPLEDHSTGLIAGQTTRFLEKHQDQPFALWVSFPDPHEPWLCPAEYAALFPPTAIDLPPGATTNSTTSVPPSATGHSTKCWECAATPPKTSTASWPRTLAWCALSTTRSARYSTSSTNWGCGSRRLWSFVRTTATSWANTPCSARAGSSTTA